MNLTLFGATGSVGRHLVQQALENGHQVCAFGRNSTRLELGHKSLCFINGDVTHYDEVDAAVKGADAVLCTLGAGRKGLLRTAGTRNIVLAMQTHRVRRLVCQTTLGAGESRGNLDFFWKYLMFGILLRSAMADHETQEAVVRASDLDWTIVRPGAFTNGPKTGKYREDFKSDDRSLALKISRADLAAFMLRQLNDRKYAGRSVGVSY